MIESRVPRSPVLRALDAIAMRSINHRSASPGDLDAFALLEDARAGVRERLRHAGIPGVLVCTCNRTELYWLSRGAVDCGTAEQILLSAAPRSGDSPPALASATGVPAARHLFRVAAGLESAVVGETEILGQLRAALRAAERDGTAAAALSELFQAALRAGRRAHAETRIGAGVRSAASAVIEVLDVTDAELAGMTVVVIGLGVTGAHAARQLAHRGVGRLVVMNRTWARAEAVARELHATPARLAELPHWIGHADAVVTAVPAEAPVVTAALARSHRACPGRRLVLVDLSRPRAIEEECRTLPAVVMHELSDIERTLARHRAGREREVRRAEAVLERELAHFAARQQDGAVRPLIRGMRQRAEAVRREAVQSAGTCGVERDALDRITRRMLVRLLHQPTRTLRRRGVLDAGEAELLQALFGLDGGEPDARD
jgi:glutamyl-tRNA reductase